MTQRWYCVGTGTTQCRHTAAEWAKRTGFAVEVARDVAGPAVEAWLWSGTGWDRVPALPPWIRLLGCSAPLYVLQYANIEQARAVETLYRLPDDERRRVRSAAAREWVRLLPRRVVAG